MNNQVILQILTDRPSEDYSKENRYLELSKRIANKESKDFIEANEVKKVPKLTSIGFNSDILNAIFEKLDYRLSDLTVYFNRRLLINELLSFLDILIDIKFYNESYARNDRVPKDIENSLEDITSIMQSSTNYSVSSFWKQVSMLRNFLAIAEYEISRGKSISIEILTQS